MSLTFPSKGYSLGDLITIKAGGQAGRQVFFLSLLFYILARAELSVVVGAPQTTLRSLRLLYFGPRVKLASLNKSEDLVPSSRSDGHIWLEIIIIK